MKSLLGLDCCSDKRSNLKMTRWEIVISIFHRFLTFYRLKDQSWKGLIMKITVCFSPNLHKYYSLRLLGRIWRKTLILTGLDICDCTTLCIVRTLKTGVRHGEVRTNTYWPSFSGPMLQSHHRRHTSASNHSVLLSFSLSITVHVAQ